MTNIFIPFIRLGYYNEIDASVGIKYTTSIEKDSVFDVKHKAITIENKDLVYVDPNCSIPRSKLREYLVKHNAKLTIDYKKASKILIPNNILAHYKSSKVHFWNGFMLSKDDILFIQKNLKDRPSDSTSRAFEYLNLKSIPAFNNLLQLKIDESPISSFLAHTYHNKKIIEYITKYYPDYVFTYRNLNHSLTQDYYNIYDEKHHDYINYLIDNGDKLFEESSITNQIQPDIVMDKNLYESVCKLFDSSDNANHVVAMETMANCNYEKSILYLLMLFKNYRNIMANCSVATQVNFKALVAYFDLRSWKYSTYSFDKILDIIKSKNLLTPEIIANITPLIIEATNEHIDNQCYIVTNIKFKDEFYEPKTDGGSQDS